MHFDLLSSLSLSWLDFMRVICSEKGLHWFNPVEGDWIQMLSVPSCLKDEEEETNRTMFKKIEDIGNFGKL